MAEEVITQQPTSQSTGVHVNPPGLSYLAQTDQLLIIQQIELLELLTGFETNNRYLIYNSAQQRIYYALEDSSICARICYKNNRPFEMLLLDNIGKQVIHLHRPYNCSLPYGLQHIEVQAPPGVVIGTVNQQWHCLPDFKVKNSAGDTLFLIKGPWCTVNICCGDVDFQVLSASNKSQIGKITKKWGGILRELCTDADIYGIEFPLDLDVFMKALLLGACFLIDSMYYEKSYDDDDHRRRYR